MSMKEFDLRKNIEKAWAGVNLEYSSLSDKNKLIMFYYKLFNIFPKCFTIYYDRKPVIVDTLDDWLDDSNVNSSESIDILYFHKNLKGNHKIMCFDSTFDTINNIIIGDHFVLCITDRIPLRVRVLSEDISYVEPIKKYIKKGLKSEKEITYNFVTHSNAGFWLRKLSLNRDKIKTSLENNYNDDLPIKEIYDFIENQLGIFIFNGIPGTGKSSLLKYLIAEYHNKKFVWMDSDLLININNSQFLDFVIDDLKDSIIILEDCEKILKDRNTSYNQSLGTLLNISDGILGDSLQLKFICTFNSDLRNIDKAVLRKGRLKGIYEFKKLNKEKTNNLCKVLNIPEMNCESTLADIYNQADIEFGQKNSNKIGF